MNSRLRQYLAVCAVLIAAAVAFWAWRAGTRKTYTPPVRDAAFWRRRATTADPRLKAQALKHLARLRDEKSIDFITRTLRTHQSGYVRAIAAECLGKFRKAECVPALRAALEDNDPRVSDSAILALGEIGGPAALDALTDALPNATQQKTVMIVVTLPAFKARKTEDALLRLLDHRSPWVRWRVIRALGQVGTRRCVPKLKELVGNPLKNTDYQPARFKKHDPTGVIERMLADAIEAASKRPPWPDRQDAREGGEP